MTPTLSDFCRQMSDALAAITSAQTPEDRRDAEDAMALLIRRAQGRGQRPAAEYLRGGK